jgi:hypothetical protein
MVLIAGSLSYLPEAEDFFSEVIREGKALYNPGEVILEKPGSIDPAEVKKRDRKRSLRGYYEVVTGLSEVNDNRW